MISHSPALSRLMYQPQFASKRERSLRYAARFYRPVIYIATIIILTSTIWRHYERQLWILVFLVLIISLYTAFFMFRMSLKGAAEIRFYQRQIQFLRGQIGIISVSLLHFLFAAQGWNTENLWLLYLLSTLLLSEHTDTRTVVFALIEVSILYTSALYLGAYIYKTTWISLPVFLNHKFYVSNNILWIWLITFVFDYLVRNIQGRDRAHDQHKKWLNLLVQKAIVPHQTDLQRATLLQCVNELTGGTAELWIPRLSDRHLYNIHGHSAPPPILEAISHNQICVAISNRNSQTYLSSLKVLMEPPNSPSISAQIILPICRVDDSQKVVGVLDVKYETEFNDYTSLELASLRLVDLADYARIVLMATDQNERQDLIERLSIHLNGLSDMQTIVSQVVDDMVNDLGFDFAAIYVIDTNDHVIRYITGKNAPWHKEAVSQLIEDNIISRVVHQGCIYQNQGKWHPYLNKYVWMRYGHRHMSRVWVPVMPPSTFRTHSSALGVIEVGFHHANYKQIPVELIEMLQHYAVNAGVVLASEFRHQRREQLINSLTALHEVGRQIQSRIALLEPEQMGELIGRSVAKLLKADFVLLYTLDEHTQKLELMYTSEKIYGRKPLNLSLYTSSILYKIYRERKTYFSSKADTDLNLVNLDANGQPSQKERTFTQRQKIRAFAGVPLIGNNGLVIGFLCINYRKLHEFSAEECKIIELFSQLASVSLEETYKHHLARKVAIAQERMSLAAELHHNLSQNLFGLEQNANSAYAQMAKGNLSKALQSLGLVREIAINSLTAFDGMLHVLNEGLVPEADLVKELAQYIRAVNHIYHSIVTFDSQVGLDSVPAQIQFYLVRIAREAIDNAIRHSRGNHIQVTYVISNDSEITLTVRDDGIGFDIDKVHDSGQYGIDIMEYYAKRINGQLAIKSRSNQGTTIQVFIAPAFPVK